MEALILMMKMHSYVVTNLEFSRDLANKKSTQFNACSHSAENDNTDAGTTTEGVQYPANLTARNFIYFLLIPTLVYELNYPTTDKIR